MLRRRMLAVADVAAVASAFALLAALGRVTPHVFAWSLALWPVWVLTAKLQGLYDRDHRVLRHLTADEVPSIVTWAAVVVASSWPLLELLTGHTLAAASVILLWALTIAAAVTLRACVRALWRRITPPERTLVIGGGRLRAAVERKLQLFSDIHADPVGHRDELDLELGEELARTAHGEPIERIILASAIDDAEIAELVRFCRANHVKLSRVPASLGMFGTVSQLAHVADLPLIEYNTWDVPRSSMALKRVMDLVGSVLALALAAPLLLAIAIAVKLDSRGPVLFVQRRAGKDGTPFRLLKFRTMVADAEERLGELLTFDDLVEPVFKLRDDPRVTRVGRFLRRLSLDELPQLVNVLRGDMSLVGPRPEQCELADRYDSEQRIRLAVKPGVTGPMQVFGRGELRLDERLAVEREYVENLSLGRDLRILLMTFAAVFGARGAY